jgi:hypothetical protein
MSPETREGWPLNEKKGAGRNGQRQSQKESLHDSRKGEK